MRITEFWENMAETFGESYASSVAADQTLPQLGGRTVNEALAGHRDVKAVWIAVCEAYGDRVPARIRRLFSPCLPISNARSIRVAFEMLLWHVATARVVPAVYRDRHG